MKKKLWITAGVVFACVITACWVTSHFVVRTDDGIAVLKKQYMSPSDSFVDIRGWTYDDFSAHRPLKRALLAQGYREVIVDLKVKQYRASFEDMGISAEAQWKLAKETVATLVNKCKSDLNAVFQKSKNKTA